MVKLVKIFNFVPFLSCAILLGKGRNIATVLQFEFPTNSDEFQGNLDFRKYKSIFGNQLYNSVEYI